MAAADRPRAEVDISVGLVRRLIALQFPELARSPVVPLATGWDNALFRIGDDLIARLPRRESAVPLIIAEQQWLPRLADVLPLPVPAPIGCGEPADEFPWPWTICPYLPGTSVLDLFDRGGTLADPLAEAERLGCFVAALHRPAPADAPANPHRGVSLADRDERFCDQVAALAYTIDPDRLLTAWSEALSMPHWAGPPLWLHGDLHPGNVVTDGDRIVGVVDFGDITSGDPATDLAAGWMFFDGLARAVFRQASETDDDTWDRGRGWALCLGVATVANSADDPAFTRHGLRTIAAVLADG